MIQDWLGYSLDGVPASDLVSPVLGTVVFIYGGHVFLIGGWREIRDRQPGMMLLISLAISVAFVASLASTAGLLDLEFWWELAALVTIMLLGHWQEMAAIGRTRGALAALAELLPDDAERITEHGAEHVRTSDLGLGDIVLVRPGARVPADGVVVEGQAEFDESMITGESRPVARSIGERVAAGTVALGASARVRVDAIGDQTALAGIQRMVAEAQASDSRAQAIADRAAAALFYVAVGVGAVTFIAWGLAGDWDAAVTRTVTVLVIACPHALGLAIPLVIAISTEVSARNGILVKNRLALERMRNIEDVLFDKTGTLTEGRHIVTGVVTPDGDDAEVLGLAAATEADSEHPLARAIVAAAKERHALAASARDFHAASGRGVAATVAGHSVQVGGPRVLSELNLSEDALDATTLEGWRARGASVLYVLVDGRLRGAVALEDKVREASRQAVAGLHESGVRVAMITGDARNVADAVARELGIDEVFAEVLPENKAEAVKNLQGRGRRVAMVGDGVNDAPALAQADVGIAIGAGTDVAIESAGVVLASDDPRGVLGIIKLSRASYKKMIQNLVWAAGYNVVTIPLAAGALSFAGVELSPAIGAVLMSLSTIIVAINAQLLRGVKLMP
jgi:Cu2+-exporting ATPase